MNPLSLSQEQYRQVYERITQVALAYLGSVGELPSFPDVSGAQAEGMFFGSVPEQGMGMAALDDLTDIIERRASVWASLLWLCSRLGRAGRRRGRSAGQRAESERHRLAVVAISGDH